MKPWEAPEMDNPYGNLKSEKKVDNSTSRKIKVEASVFEPKKDKPSETIIDGEKSDRSLGNGESASAILELLLCPPKYLSAEVANNKWMKEMSPEDRKVNVDRAMAEFQTMYSLMSQDAMCYLLPPKEGLQDEVYISNAGMVLPHMKDKTMILANFKAPGRPGEEEQLKIFADMMEYKTFTPVAKFEGEAELKWLRDNIYMGGYGIRTEEAALDWIAKEFDANIIKIKENDPLAYHLDCTVFPLSNTKVIVAKDLMEDKAIKELEKYAELIPINKKQAQYGLTNCVRIGSIVYAGTYIKTLKKDHEEYPLEKSKNERLEKICIDNGLSPIFVQLAEFNKSGAMLSCCVLHLSYTTFFDMDK